jgi:tetratricopeptide (TPR) repeat protein
LKLASEMGITGAMLRNLHEGLGDAYAIAAKYPAALEQYAQALTLPQNTRRRAGLHRKKGEVFERSGLLDDAVRSFREALSLLQGSNDLVETGHAYGGLGRVHYLQGDFRGSVELGGLAREIAERRGDLRGVAYACNGLSLARAKLGEPEKAMEEARRALSIWEERKDAYGLSATYNILGQLALLRGEYKDAGEMFLRSIDLCKQTGNRHGLASAYDNLGQALALDGDPEEGAACLAKAVTILSDIGSENEELMPELWQRSGIW